MNTATLEPPATETDAADLDLLANSAGADPIHETADVKTEPMPRAPLVTLWLPDVKSSKAVVIYGMSGKKYIFQKTDATQGRPARPYFDGNLFEREERDMRGNRRNLIAVCTLLGKSDLAARAGEGVQALIGATKIPAGMRKAALHRVSEIAAAGLAGLGHIAEPSASDRAQAPVTPSAPVPVPAVTPPAGAKEADPATPAKTWLPKEAYSDAQLNNLPLEDLRALAACYAVPGSFRREIVRAWFKKA